MFDHSPHTTSETPIGFQVAAELAAWGDFWLVVLAIFAGLVAFATVMTIWKPIDEAKRRGMRRRKLGEYEMQTYWITLGRGMRKGENYANSLISETYWRDNAMIDNATPIVIEVMYDPESKESTSKVIKAHDWSPLPTP